MSQQYDYTNSGYDAFLSRSIDNLSQVNLDSQGPQTTQIRYDSSQVSGQLGDILTIGNVIINGVLGRISIYDENDIETTRLGKLND